MTCRDEPLGEVPRLLLEESEDNRIMLQQLDTGDQQVIV